MKNRIITLLLVAAMMVTYMPSVALGEITGVDSTSTSVRPVVIAKAVPSGANKVKLSWNKTTGATYYKIYGSLGQRKTYKLIAKKVKKNSYTVKKLYGKKLKKHGVYRFKVSAYTKGNSKAIASSVPMFVVTTKTWGKYANVSSIKLESSKKFLLLDKRDYDVYVGEPQISIYKNKKLLPDVFASKYRYTVSNPAVLKLNSKGLIKPLNVGTTDVYIQAINGKSVKVNVKVAEYIVKLTFDKNSSAAYGEMPVQKFERGVAQKINSNTFTNSGNKFLGWAETKDGAVKYTDKQEITLFDNTTLYAVWEKTEEPTPTGGGGTPEKSDEEKLIEAKDAAIQAIKIDVSGVAINCKEDNFEISDELKEMIASAESQILSADSQENLEQLKKQLTNKIHAKANEEVLNANKDFYANEITEQITKHYKNEAGEIEEIPLDSQSETMKKLYAKANAAIASADDYRTLEKQLETNPKSYLNEIKEQQSKETIIKFDSNDGSGNAVYQVIKVGEDEQLSSDALEVFEPANYDVLSSEAKPIGGMIYAFIANASDSAEYIFYDATCDAILEVSGNSVYNISDDAITELSAGATENAKFFASADSYSVSGRAVYFEGWNINVDGAERWYASSDAISSNSSELITLYAQWHPVDNFYVVATDENDDIIAHSQMKWANETRLQTDNGMIGYTLPGLGNGRRNTKMALNSINEKALKTDTYTQQSSYDSFVWPWIKHINSENTSGCNDWFIGTGEELLLLWESPVSGTYLSAERLAWTSVQEETDVEYAKVAGDGKIDRDEINQEHYAIAIRAF